MVLFPHCKINLGLFVLEKRADNFHNIETVFYPVDLCDALEIVPEKTKTVFNISG
ncbi:MAG: 4-(cytidine 5'-diphospho)-2-C-methyl-D-erythritol kinase, partial [Bacteroidales bacterium]|nr:4-(cytidine 5'-diphospho)-2-C-methyl-D-erythritol kinase [Bacteroidales bacterium]